MISKRTLSWIKFHVIRHHPVLDICLKHEKNRFGISKHFLNLQTLEICLSCHKKLSTSLELSWQLSRNFFFGRAQVLSMKAQTKSTWIKCFSTVSYRVICPWETKRAVVMKCISCSTSIQMKSSATFSPVWEMIGSSQDSRW